MKWKVNQVAELHDLCMAEVSNADMAKHFDVPVTEIYAARSRYNLTMPKIASMKGKPAMMTVNPEFEEAVQEMEAESFNGLETFVNAGELCIVLHRHGSTALIVRPSNRCTPFIVPLQHWRGQTSWCHGRYFRDFPHAYAQYMEDAHALILEELQEEKS